MCDAVPVKDALRHAYRRVLDRAVAARRRSAQESEGEESNTLSRQRPTFSWKGSLRRAKQRRALDCCAPFRPSSYCDGRLRRDHETPRYKTKTTTWSLKA